MNAITIRWRFACDVGPRDGVAQAVTAQGQASQLPAGQTGGTVLLVEDEEAIGAIVRTYLGRDGYRVVWVRTGEEALAEFTRHPIRIVVLDIGLPGVDGFEVCRRIRAQSAVPILMLTARDESRTASPVSSSAPTTTCRPFSPRELVARVKAILRRSEPSPRENRIELDDVCVDVEGREVVVGGEAVELTAKEFDLLRYFLESPGVVHSRDRLLDRVWGMTIPAAQPTSTWVS